MPMPGRLKKPPLAAAPAAGAPAMPGLPGWLMVRLNGCAAPGAVEVDGGAEKLLEPREPELEPPPIAGIGRRGGDDRGRQGQRHGDGDGTDQAAGALREFHGVSLKSPTRGAAT